MNDVDVPNQSEDDRRRNALEALKQAQAKAKAGPTNAKPCDVEENIPIAGYDALARAVQALEEAENRLYHAKWDLEEEMHEMRENAQLHRKPDQESDADRQPPEE